MSLLPSEPDTDDPDASPRVIGVDSEDAEDVLAALSSETARELLSVLHEDPAPPSRLADEVDTSLQNAQYHLEKLETAGAVEVVDTAYSAKGREMDVYAPAAQPLVIFAGDEGESTLRSALSRLLGAVGVLAVGSLVVQRLFGREGILSEATDGGTGASGGTGGAPTGGDAAQAADATETATDGGFSVQSAETETPAAVADRVTETAAAAANATVDTTTEAARTAAEGAAGLPPGLLFFAGGLVALAVVAVALAVR